MSRQFCDNTRKIYLASCLYDCIEDNNIRAVDKLLNDNGANPNIIIPGRGITPFHLAIGNGVEKTAEEITRLFLSHGGNPNVRSDEKLTPVHIAAAWGRVNILNILLKCGGDPTLRDDQGKTPLDYAREEGHWDIVDQLEDDVEPETQYDKLQYDITLDKVIINNGVLVAEYGVSGIDDIHRTLPYDLKTALVPLPEVAINSYVENWCVKHANIIHDNYNVSSINDLSNDKLIINRPHSLNSSDNDKDSTNYCNDRLNENYVSIRKKTDFNIDQVINEPKIPKKKLNICLDYSSSDENNLNQKYSPEKTEPYLIDKRVIEHNELNDSFKYISSEESMLPSKMCKISGVYTLPSDSSHMSSFSVKDNLNMCVIVNNSDTNTKQSSSSSEYLTCDEAKSVNSLEKNILNSIMTLDLTDKFPAEQDKYPDITLDLSNPIENTNFTKNHLTNIPCQLSVLPGGPNESMISVAEEYKYIDKEEGIVLIEKRILTNQKLEDNKSSASTISCAASKASSLPSVIDYDTDTLRKELTIRGEPPGPITKTTKRVYLRQLKNLKKTTVYIPPAKIECNRVYSVELEKTLRNPDWTNDLTAFKDLEQMVVQQFSNPEPTKRWREGLTKASFTYLLLDPRITNNLPGRSEKLSIEDTWKIFLSSIFYVGKGKRSRPYSHLYEAVTFWNTGVSNKNSKKIKYILDVWKDQYGVICLHIFQNVIPVEAYTREAAMINALKLQNLCNSKTGDFYGVSATWPERQKRLLGVYLLYRAMLIFLNEGERQLRPDDIGK